MGLIWAIPWQIDLNNSLTDWKKAIFKNVSSLISYKNKKKTNFFQQATPKWFSIMQIMFCWNLCTKLGLIWTTPCPTTLNNSWKIEKKLSLKKFFRKFCSRGLWFLTKLTRVQTLRLNVLLNAVPFLLNTFSVFNSFVPCMPAIFTVTLARNFPLSLWSMNDTVDPISSKAYVFSLVLPLWIDIETIRWKLVTLLFWRIVFALTLTEWMPSSFNCFSECSNWLCWLVPPIITQTLTLQSLIAFSFRRHP